MEIHGLNVRIRLGDREVLRCPSWSIESERHLPLGRANITLPDPQGELWRTVAQGDGMEIRYGYRGQTVATWKGSALYKRRGATADQITIGAADGALPLQTTRVVQSWENETPEAIVSWAIRQAGLTPGMIGATGVALPRFVASGIPVWQVATQAAASCARAFGLDMDRWALWLGADGQVHWGDLDEPGATPVIATGAGLISHAPDGSMAGLNKVETFLRPGLMHSRLFRLRDNRRGIDETFRALRVRHEGAPDRVRTHIWYGEEHGRI